MNNEIFLNGSLQLRTVSKGVYTLGTDDIFRILYLMDESHFQFCLYITYIQAYPYAFLYKTL